MIKLHYHPLSTYTRRVRIALIEKGIEHELVTVDLAARKHREPEYLAINPYGRVPTLQEDDFLLWESNAILAYLAKKYPEKKLWPEGGRGEADALRWLFYETSTLQPAIADVGWARWLTPRLGAGIPPAVPDPSVTGLERPLNVLNDHIRTREWVLDSFTVVDCALAAPLLMMELSNVPMDRWAGVASYWRRWKTRASFAATPFRFPGE